MQTTNNFKDIFGFEPAKTQAATPIETSIVNSKLGELLCTYDGLHEEKQALVEKYHDGIPKGISIEQALKDREVALDLEKRTREAWNAFEGSGSMAKSAGYAVDDTNKLREDNKKATVNA